MTETPLYRYSYYSHFSEENTEVQGGPVTLPKCCPGTDTPLSQAEARAAQLRHPHPIISHPGATIDFEQTSATYNHDKARSYWNWIRLWNYAQPPDVILEAGGMAGQGERGRGVVRGLGAAAESRGWGESEEQGAGAGVG